MTPDAHPIVGRIGEGVYAACGFSGHGFMQSPAVGLAVAEEICEGESSFDLSPYRLERFEGAAVFPEEVVLYNRTSRKTRRKCSSCEVPLKSSP